MRIGLPAVTRDAADAGADGFLVLDLPSEESDEFVGHLRRNRLDNICLVAPTSTDERIAKIVQHGSGFVYCVAREGVTGKMNGITSASADLVRRTRRHTSLPVALGFGISTPAQARDAARGADAVIVGSAIVRAYHEAPSTRAGRQKVASWVRPWWKPPVPLRGKAMTHGPADWPRRGHQTVRNRGERSPEDVCQPARA